MEPHENDRKQSDLQRSGERAEDRPQAGHARSATPDTRRPNGKCERPEPDTQTEQHADRERSPGIDASEHDRRSERHRRRKRNRPRRGIAQFKKQRAHHSDVRRQYE